MKALILVDIQGDFLPGGRLPVPKGDQIITVVNNLQHWFELIVATQDWHPSNHKSFASQHPGRKPFESIDLNGLDQTLWPDHCILGSTGAGFPELLNMNRVEAIFRKGTDPDIDSYSGFYDNGHRKSTGLAGYLREKNVTSIWLAGLAGDICVYATALDSLNENFHTTIITDAVKPLNQEIFETRMQDFISKGGKLISSSGLE